MLISVKAKLDINPVPNRAYKKEIQTPDCKVFLSTPALFSYKDWSLNTLKGKSYRMCCENIENISSLLIYNGELT